MCKLSLRTAIFYSFITGLLLLSSASAQRSVSVGMLRLVSNAPLFIGIERGYFADEGLAIDEVYFSAAAPIATALASTAIDVGATGITGGLYNTIAGGLGARIVFDKGRVSEGFETSGLFVSNALADEVSSLEDLRGRTVGVTQIGSTFHYMLGELLLLEGMELSDVSVVPLNSLQALQEALRSGRIDSAILPQPVAGNLLAEEGAQLLLWADDFLDYQVAAVFYSAGFMLDSAAAQAFARAYVRSVREYHDACIASSRDSEACQEIIAIIADYTQAAPDVVRDGLYFMERDGALGLESIAAQLDWYYDQGFVARLQVDDVVDTNWQQEAAQRLP